MSGLTPEDLERYADRLRAAVMATGTWGDDEHVDLSDFPPNEAAAFLAITEKVLAEFPRRE